MADPADDGTSKKRQQAVALKYEALKGGAPKVTAKGKGLLAEKIIEMARANNIPIREDSDLVELLAKVELNREIPEELYKAVAEILAFVYRMNEKWKQQGSKKS